MAFNKRIIIEGIGAKDVEFIDFSKLFDSIREGKMKERAPVA